MFPTEYEIVPPECLLTTEMEYLCICKCDKHALYCLMQTDQWNSQEPLEWSSRQ